MEKFFLVKVHEAYRRVVAICDKELFGNKFEDGEKQLDLTGRFFQGKESDYNDLNQIVEQSLYEDATFYIVGKKSIEHAKKIKLINESGVKFINDIPFALILL
jgi:hypothetical protein